MSTNTAQKRTMSLEQFAQTIGMGRSAAYLAAKEGRLPVKCIRIGSRYFIPTAAVERLLNGETTDGKSAA